MLLVWKHSLQGSWQLPTMCTISQALTPQRLQMVPLQTFCEELLPHVLAQGTYLEDALAMSALHSAQGASQLQQRTRVRSVRPVFRCCSKCSRDVMSETKPLMRSGADPR